MSFFRGHFGTGGLVLLTLFLLMAGTAAGAYAVPLPEWFADGELNPIIRLRLLRMTAALVIGASLSVSGMTFQAVLRNPLAEPFTLGISGGAGVGAALAVLLGLRAVSWTAMPLAAFAGALLTLWLVLHLSRGGQRGAENLLLSGVIAGTVAGSILMYLLSIAQMDELSSITWWLLGDLQNVPAVMLGPGAAVLLVCTLFLRWSANGLNALSLGDSEAWNLGFDPRRLTRFAVLAASFLAAQTVAMAGIIGFCGLIVPHLVRRLYGCCHRRIIFPVFFAGASFLMFCDILSRVVHPERELPVGVITSLVGGPLFLWLINRRRGNET